MKIHLERGRVVIEQPDLSAELLVNGQLQAEINLGVPEGPECFRERLRKANASQAACAIMRSYIRSLEPEGKASAREEAARVAGFLAGLRGEYRRLYPKDSGVANAVQAPDCGPHPERQYRHGWEAGSAVWAVVQFAETGEDPRKEW